MSTADMKTTTVKVLSAKKEVASHTIQQGEVLVLQAQDKVNYQLINDATGRGPQNILAKRDGKNLVITLDEGNTDPDIIIENYYADDNVNSMIVGLHENGNIYAYVPESGQTADAVSMLAEEMVKPQALGGEELSSFLWAFNPWWLVGAAAVIGGVAIAAGGTTGGNTGNGTDSTTGGNTGNATDSTTGGNTGNGTDSTTGGNTGNGTGSTTGDNTGNGTGSTTGDNTGNGTGSTTGDNTGNGTGSTTGDNTGNGTGSTTGDNTGNGTGSTTGGNTGNGTGSTTGDNTGNGTGSTTGDNTGNGTGSTTGDNTGNGTGSTTGDNTGNGTGSTTGDNTGNGTGSTTGDNTGNGTGSTTGDNTGNGTGSTTGDNTGNGTGSTTGDNTGNGTGSTTGDNTGNGTGSTTGDNTGNGTGSTTGDNTGNGTGSTTGDNTGNGTGSTTGNNDDSIIPGDSNNNGGIDDNDDSTNNVTIPTTGNDSIITPKNTDGKPNIIFIEDTNKDGTLNGKEVGTNNSTPIAITIPDNTKAGDKVVVTINGETKEIPLTQEDIDKGYVITEVPTTGKDKIEVTAKVVDTAGNESGTGSNTVVVDHTPIQPQDTEIPGDSNNDGSIDDNDDSTNNVTIPTTGGDSITTPKNTDGKPNIIFIEDTNKDGTLNGKEVGTNNSTPIAITIPDNTKAGDKVVVTINGEAKEIPLTQEDIDKGYVITEVPTTGKDKIEVTAKVVDTAGNESGTGTGSVLVDTTIPGDSNNNGGIDDNDDSTNNVTIPTTGNDSITTPKNTDGKPNIIFIEDTNKDGTLNGREVGTDNLTPVAITIPDNTKAGDKVVVTINGEAKEIPLTQEDIDKGYVITEVPTTGKNKIEVTAKVVDTAGNESGTGTGSVLVDTTIPGDSDNNDTVPDTTAPTITLDPVKAGDTKVTGTTEPNTEVTVTLPNGNTTTVISGNDGKFEAPLPVPAKENDTVSVTAKDKSNNVSDPVTSTVPDTTAPTITLDPVKAGDTKVTGTTEPNTEVTVTLPNGNTTTVISGNDGKFEAPLPVPAKENDTVSVTAKDKSNNVSDPVTSTVPDTTAPTITLDPVNAGDTKVTGTTEPNTEVTVTLPNGNTTTVISGNDGKFEAPLPVPAKENDTVSVTAKDKSNNVSDPVTSTVPDTTAPAITLDPVNAGDTKVTGTTEPNTEVTVTLPNGNTTTVTSGTDGKFEAPLPVPAKENDTVSVTAKDKSNNVSDPVTSTVPDTTAPAITLDPVNAGDTKVTGTTEPNTEVTVTLPNGNTTTVTSGTDGKFEAPLPVPAKENDTVSAVAKDKSNNVSDPVTSTVPDTTAPAITLDPVKAGDTKVTGTTEPNTEVTVTLPNGNTTTVTSGNDGKFEAPLPVPAKENDTVSAVAKDKSNNVSDPVTSKVPVTPADPVNLDPKDDGSVEIIPGANNAKLVVTYYDETGSVKGVEGMKGKTHTFNETTADDGSVPVTVTVGDNKQVTVTLVKQGNTWVAEGTNSLPAGFSMNGSNIKIHHDSIMGDTAISVVASTANGGESRDNDTAKIDAATADANIYFRQFSEMDSNIQNGLKEFADNVAIGRDKLQNSALTIDNGMDGRTHKAYVVEYAGGTKYYVLDDYGTNDKAWYHADANFKSTGQLVNQGNGDVFMGYHDTMIFKDGVFGALPVGSTVKLWSVDTDKGGNWQLQDTYTVTKEKRHTDEQIFDPQIDQMVNLFSNPAITDRNIYISNDNYYSSGMKELVYKWNNTPESAATINPETGRKIFSGDKFTLSEGTNRYQAIAWPAAQRESIRTAKYTFTDKNDYLVTTQSIGILSNKGAEEYKVKTTLFDFGAGADVIVSGRDIGINDTTQTGPLVIRAGGGNDLLVAGAGNKEIVLAINKLTGEVDNFFITDTIPETHMLLNSINNINETNSNDAWQGGRIFNAQIHMDAGHDTLIVEGTAPQYNEAAIEKATITMGEGDDIMKVAPYSSTRGNVNNSSIDLGAGDDYFTMGGHLTGSTIVKGGAGMDTFQFAANNTSVTFDYTKTTGFEWVILQGGNMNLTWNSVANAGLEQTLQVYGSGQVTLDGFETPVGKETIPNTQDPTQSYTFNVYQNGELKIMIEEGITVI